jgi:hypothetical protein
VGCKKGSAPDPLQLLRDQDPARYLIIVLMETIKDLYKNFSTDPIPVCTGPDFKKKEKIQKPQVIAAQVVEALAASVDEASASASSRSSHYKESNSTRPRGRRRAQ